MQIGFVLFPDLTQLDLTGPLQVLHRLPGATTHLVAASLDPVPTDCGFSLQPDVTFADCPPLDVLCVPGGGGVAAALSDAALIDFVRARAAHVRYITSVCTGAFILGKAGVLAGRRATTHWAYTGLLEAVGAVHVPGRVVRDGNIVTGGGVTAGIDFALTIAAELTSPVTAQAIQLAIEYRPEPPFAAGDPDKAPEPCRQALAGFYEASRERLRKALA